MIGFTKLEIVAVYKSGALDLPLSIAVQAWQIMEQVQHQIECTMCTVCIGVILVSRAKLSFLYTYMPVNEITISHC